MQSIAKLAQRVQRECTGYYCGYTFKGQPVGRRMVNAAQESLCHLTTGLEDKPEGQQWHRLTNRVLKDLNHCCLTRTTAEEWNLATFHDDHDMKNAEFMRSFRTIDFNGMQLLQRSEAEVKKLRGTTIQKVLPPQKNQKRKEVESFCDTFQNYVGIAVDC